MIIKSCNRHHLHGNRYCFSNAPAPQRELLILCAEYERLMQRGEQLEAMAETREAEQNSRAQSVSRAACQHKNSWRSLGAPTCADNDEPGEIGSLSGVDSDIQAYGAPVVVELPFARKAGHTKSADAIYAEANACYDEACAILDKIEMIRPASLEEILGMLVISRASESEAVLEKAIAGLRAIVSKTR